MESDDVVREERRAVAARSVGHIGGECRVWFAQGGRDCPMFRVDGSPAAYLLLEDGPFSVCVRSDVKAPLIVKLEEDGRVLGGEYRLFPGGSRTIKDVHESFVATRRPLVYHFPAVFDNLLQREVGPEEVELHSMDEAQDLSTPYCVKFFYVKGGMAAARYGEWTIDYKRKPLAVETIRVGHRAPLARLFGVTLPALTRLPSSTSFVRKPSSTTSTASLPSRPARPSSFFSKHVTPAALQTPRRRDGSGQRSRSAHNGPRTAGPAAAKTTRRGRSAGNGTTTASQRSSSSKEDYRNWCICVRCNTLFDCERRMYNNMIASLKEEVISLRREMARLEDRWGIRR